MENKHLIQVVLLVALLPFVITWHIFERGHERGLRELTGRWSWVPEYVQASDSLVRFGDELIEALERILSYATN